MAERPMRLAVILSAMAGAAVAMTGLVAIAKIPGAITWGVSESRADGTVQFSISYRTTGRLSTNSHAVQLSTLAGLTAPQIQGTGPVSFRLSRDAGRLDCQGTARRGAASGGCEFTENPAFAEALRERGIGGVGSDELFRMTLHDVGTAYVEELKRQRYATPDGEDLARAGEHGATLAYLQGMAGYRLADLDGLIRARDHGVTPTYAEGLKAAGYGGLSAEDLIRLRDHGVSTDFVSALQKAGYRKVPAEDLVRMRDHGVSAGFVRELVALGYGHLTPDELTQMRDHGVTASFVRRVVESGRKPSADDLIEMSDTGEFRTARP